MIVEIIRGDITAIEVDVIVNAANTSLLGGGGVDGAIHRKGGKTILEECQQIRNRQGGCEVGAAVITKAGNLPAKKLIHTVGPKWNNGISNEENKLASCYTESLKLAEENNLKTIAFPNISTGIYGYPKQAAAEIAFKTISEWNGTIEKVIFVCFDDDNFSIYTALHQSQIKAKENIITSAFLGQAIGDALGVPVEFKSRTFLKENPVVDYLGYKCWNQPPGTFSDDSSMMFCTAESLCNGFDLTDMANRFVSWYNQGYWGAHFKVFDIGGTTRRSLDRVDQGESPEHSGEFFAENNGNGSLMRILPMLFFLQNEKDISKRYQLIKKVSGITHAHFRSVFSCFIFVEFGLQLLKNSKIIAFHKMIELVKNFAIQKDFNPEELSLFSNILDAKILTMQEDEIESQGYVLHSIESSIWCLLQTESYAESVLKAVNLGGDTDTTAAINGGLSGLYYGIDKIPKKWIKELVRVDDIIELSNRFKKTIK